MMKVRWKGLFLGMAVALFVTGCAPEEKDVCAHMISVFGDKPDKPRYLDDTDSCVDAWAKKKTRRGVNSYRREVECILKSDTAYKIRRCIEAENARQ